MEKKLNSLLMLFILFTLAACGDAENNQNTTAEDVAEKGKELMETTKDFAEEEYAELTGSIESFKAGMQQKMSTWKDKVESMSEELKQDYRDRLNDLEAQQKALDEKVEEYKNAAESEKGELKAEVKQLQDALKKSVDAFESEMQDKQ